MGYEFDKNQRDSRGLNKGYVSGPEYCSFPVVINGEILSRSYIL